jgi:hypothetical protein
VNRVKNGFGLLVGVLIGAVVAAPVGVLASHRFSDVPDSSPIHDDVETLDAAGVVRGCGASGANYCPDRAVTRGQMAQYLSRSMPSVSAHDFESAVNNPWPAVPLATIDVAVPGRPGGRQHVRVDANIGMEGSNEGGGQFYLGDESGEVSPIRNLSKASSSPVATRTITAVFEVDSGTTETVTLYGSTAPGSSVFVRGELVAETFPRSNAAG